MRHAEDHPRSRGVHCRSPAPSRRRKGSSPLARGPLFSRIRDVKADRIIPARAGSTHLVLLHTHHPQDHPRSRGVHHPWSAHRPRRRGSSPLARGPLWLAHFKHIDVRIIPARAGSTLSMPGLAKPGRDHPRSRGVHHLSPERATRSLGSSPLARGPPPLVSASPTPERIIPARAGSTAVRHLHRGAVEDHPRSRGVHQLGRDGNGDFTGSSPLARGPPVFARSVGAELGIIPARAGSTVVAAGVALYKKDHPRSRGVHKCSSRWMSARSGSSPLARGPRRRCCGTFSGRRIIPARAGSTSLCFWFPELR